MGVEEVVQGLTSSFSTRSCITALRHLPRQTPRYAAFPSWISPLLLKALQKEGIEQLYSHQAEAVERVHEGGNVVVVTPTASGKTLCYNLPVLNRMLEDKDAKALYLFPTKALSQDQVAELHHLVELMDAEVGVYTYDGDTPQDARKAIRSRANIVVTNPDMLHTGILPHHTKWVKLLENLKFVVIDEIHQYRGVFGSHVCNVIRRLKRICRFYGSSPRFICCSATIANPEELASKLIEEEVGLVDDNGAPSGEKYFIFYNPPVVNRQLGIRANYLSQARKLTTRFLTDDVQTIVFATSRLNVEVLVKYLRDSLRLPPGKEEKIRGYRGGYLPLVRRQIEKGLRDGRVEGVVSTSALELGIDIGSLDACIIAGYPGTIAATWQQAGRAGRRSGRSAAVMVGRSNPLDQFIMLNPDYFFGRSPERGLINPDNLVILIGHIKCAAFELPFSDGERFGNEETGEILKYLEEEGVLHRTGGRWHWMADAYPANEISLRSVSEDNFVVVDGTREAKVIGEVDFTAAPGTLYEDAIYMSESRQYQVERLDWTGRKAYVREVDADYFTDAIDYTTVRILDRFETADDGPATREHGEVQVVNRVVGYKKVKFYTMENVGYGDVNLPQQEMHTTSYWFTIREDALASLNCSRQEIVDGLLGLAYLMHHISCFLLMCDVRDLHRSIGDRSAEWHVRVAGNERRFQGLGVHPMPLDPDQLDRFEPTIFIYDNYPGGVGFSQELFNAHPTLLGSARRVIETCRCFHGCPSCVGPVNEVGLAGKEVAAALLRLIIEGS